MLILQYIYYEFQYLINKTDRRLIDNKSFGYNSLRTFTENDFVPKMYDL